MAKQRAKPHLQNKSPMFADAARADEARAHDRDARDNRAPADARSPESDTLVADRDEARQNRPAKGRKQSRGSDSGPRGRRRN